jgi:hypothetical protein
VPNCIGSTACFSWLWVRTRPKLRVHFAKPSAPQRSRSRFRWRHAQKQPTQDTVGKRRAGEEPVDFDYPFANLASALTGILPLPSRSVVDLSQRSCSPIFCPKAAFCAKASASGHTRQMSASEGDGLMLPFAKKSGGARLLHRQELPAKECWSKYLCSVAPNN